MSSENQIPDWAMHRADEEYVAHGEGNYRRALASYIMRHETKPVHPDVLVVREILASFARDDIGREQFMSGDRDDAPAFADALRIYRAAMAPAPDKVEN